MYMHGGLRGGENFFNDPQVQGEGHIHASRVIREDGFKPRKPLASLVSFVL
jgi:hypothetical protein